jgi:hypothetical protein
MRDFILALVVVVMAVAGTAVAQQPTMEEIVKKWDARRAAVTRAVGVLEVETTYPKLEKSGTANEQLARDDVHKYRCEFSISFDSSKLYFECEASDFSQESRQFIYKNSVNVYDGVEYRTAVYPLNGPNSNTHDGKYFADVAVHKSGLDRSPSLNVLLRPIILDCGRISGSMSASFYPATFATSSLSQVSDLVSGHTPGPGSDRSTLRFFPQKAGTSAPDMELVVRHNGWTQPLALTVQSQGKKVSTLVIDRNSDGDLSGFTSSHYVSRATRPYRVDRAKVIEYRQNVAIDDARFRLPVAPGLVVAVLDESKKTDNEAGEKVMSRFVVDEAGQWRAYPATPPTTSWARTIIGITSLAVSILVFCRLRKTRNPPESRFLNLG